MSNCRKCAQPVADGVKFCSECGTAVNGCPKCGQPIVDGIKFCTECGTCVVTDATRSNVNEDRSLSGKTDESGPKPLVGTNSSSPTVELKFATVEEKGPHRKAYIIGAALLAAIIVIPLSIYVLENQPTKPRQDPTVEDQSNTTAQATAKETEAPSANPDPRTSAVSWIDKGGNMWLYGGSNYTSRRKTYLDDLWKYDPKANKWIQIGVGSSASNYSSANSDAPDARDGAVTWRDSSDDLWLFSGFGMSPQGLLNSGRNDLWKYSLTSNSWTRVADNNFGSYGGIYGAEGVASTDNIPGVRERAVSWIDQGGNLWVFGGNRGDGSTASTYDYLDLWKYNPAANAWTWVSGSNKVGTPGKYGEMGVSSPDNFPGAREGAVGWIDSHGHLWLFGGVGGGNLGANAGGEFSDLWEFNPVASAWTWVSGSAGFNQVGNYGTKGVPSTGNLPTSRDGAVSWIDGSGNLWLFGGEFRGSYFNDLWKYNPEDNTWTWVNGSEKVDVAGEYGSKGVPSTDNSPGARMGAVSWIDSSGDLWLFGGDGLSAMKESCPYILTGPGPGSGCVASQIHLIYQDLWKFDPKSNTWTWVEDVPRVVESGGRRLG